MTTKTVKIVQVLKDYEKEKRDGGTYVCTLVVYEEGNYTKEIPIANAFLSKNPTLKDKLHSLKDGQLADLVLQKNGMYTNLVDVKSASEGEIKPAATSSHKTTPSTFVSDNALGMQVGNALNNAALLMAHGKSSMGLEDTALMVLEIGERLKARLKSGDLTTKKEESGAIIEEDDIPFGE